MRPPFPFLAIFSNRRTSWGSEKFSPTLLQLENSMHIPFITSQPLATCLMVVQPPGTFLQARKILKNHTFFDCPMSSCCSSCSPFVPLLPLAAHLMDLLHLNFFCHFRHFARYPLVHRFHMVRCWFHSSSPVSSRFLLFMYSSCWFHSSSPFSYGSSPILPWFTICVWFIAGFTPVRQFHLSSCCLHAAPHQFHPGFCHSRMVLFALFTSSPILRCIYSLIMTLKLDHIPTLDGAAEYPSWSKSIMCTL